MEMTTNKMGCFTVNWEIRNCSLLLSDIHIQSADFKLMMSEKSVWAHCVLFNGATHMKIKLCPIKGILDYDTMEFSLTSSGREILVPKEASDMIPKSAIFGDNSASLLHDDTLTVCCRMWKATIETGEISIRTVLHRDYFFWNIENFNPYTSSNHTYIEKHNFLFYMRMEWNADQRTHTFLVEELPNIGGWLSFLYIKPSLSALCGRIISKRGLSFETKRWDIEIFTRDDATSNFQIKLYVIFAIHKEIHDRPIGSSGALNEDLLHLFREALHSDAVLNAMGKSFPVHKNILSTRSEVFRAMFEKDQMKEGREGVVAIEDLDSKTVNRMLVFLYSDVLEDITWAEASALYYAADKYAVLNLKRKCTEILKAGLSVSNACYILALADKHSDHELMKSTVDFIVNHKEVVSSHEWELLEESNPRLTSKTTKEIIFKLMGEVKLGETLSNSFV